jgi:5-methylthioribose kinase
MCALYKAYTGERAWKAIGDMLQAPSYLSRVYHYWKIIAIKQRRDIGKYSFVNRSVTDCNQLPEWAIGTSYGKTRIFKTSVKKLKTRKGSDGDKK